MRDWRRLIGNRQLSSEAIDELAQHLEDTFQAVLARGGDESAAMKSVQDELASLDRTTKSLDIRTPRIGLLEQILQFIQIDLRDALRRLRRSPGFSLLAIVVLAVGLGVNTAIFSVINAVLFKPLPVRAPNELVFMYYVSNGYYGAVPSDLYAQLAANTAMFKQIAGANSDAAWVTIDGQTERVLGNGVTAGYFETLGVAPRLGRTFSPDEDSAGAAPTLVISDQLWTLRFHRDPAIVGKTLRLSRTQSLTEAVGRDYTIVGVLPAGFSGTGSKAAWLSPSYYVPIHQRSMDPVCANADGTGTPNREWPVSLFGRLADGVTFKTAADFVAQSGPAWQREWSRTVGPPLAGNRFELRQTHFAQLPIDAAGNIVPERLATALVIVSGLLLLIAASNLVGIFMARSVATRTDTAIRLSLGAGRWRVARQHLTEGYLLAIAGTAAGFVVAGALTRLFVAYLPASNIGSGAPGSLGGSAVSVDVPLDARVLMFAVATCAIVGAVIGLGPARQASKTDVLPTLQLAAVTSVRSRKGLRHWIVVPQIAVALVLLLVSGAVSRTVIVSEMADPGYVPEGLVAVQFQLPSPDRCIGKLDYSVFRRRRDELIQKISNQFSKLSSIQSAAISSFLPHETTLAGSVIRREDAGAGQSYGVRLFEVSADYFTTMKIPIVAGRGFTEADSRRRTSENAGVVVISRKLAATLWPNQDGVGHSVARFNPESTLPPRWAEVVGIADDVMSPLHEGYPAPAMYSPAAAGAFTDRVVARAKTSEADAIREIAAVVRSADSAAVVVGAGTVSAGISQIRFARRLAIAILGSAALIGLALAAIGLYGVVSYALSQRLREFGIRAALGASYRDLIALVFKEALMVASIGSAIGLAAAYSAIGLISSKLVAIPSVNLGIVIAGPAIVFIAVALACYLPARRAARVDPLIVLRGL